MKIAIVILLFFISAIQAQLLEWKEIPVDLGVRFLHFPTPDTGWAEVGGDLYVTTDGGNAWTQLNHGKKIARYDDNACRKIMSLYKNNIWFIGHDNDTLHHSEDGGITWNNYLITQGSFRSINFYDESHGIAVSDTVPYWTEDSGRTWHEADRDSLAKYIYIRCIHMIDSIHAWAAGHSTSEWDIGKIIYTDDGGKSWKTLGETDILNTIFALDTLHIVAAGLNATRRTGVILVTKNGGNTWQHTFINRFAENVVFLNSKIGLVYGEGLVWQTLDGGETWTQIEEVTDAGNISRSDNALFISTGQLLKYEPSTSIRNRGQNRLHPKSPSFRKDIRFDLEKSIRINRTDRFDLLGRDIQDTRFQNSGVYIERLHQNE